MTSSGWVIISHRSVRMPTNPAIFLSVIVPAYNEAELLGANLDRIKDALTTALPPNCAWELIVCDNNSTDQTAEIARQAGAQVIFEAHQQISKARNTGARIARGEWLLFLDADSYPSPALLRDMWELMQTDQFLGCGTTIEVAGGSRFNQLRMERLNILFRLFKMAGGVCLLCRRVAFEAIKGFGLDLYAYEEFDFIWRLKKWGKAKGQQFTVLYHNPVITSGRKGEWQLGTIARLIGSHLLATLLFIFRPIIPRRVRQWIAKKGLVFWYESRKDKP